MQRAARIGSVVGLTFFLVWFTWFFSNNYIVEVKPYEYQRLFPWSDAEAPQSLETFVERWISNFEPTDPDQQAQPPRQRTPAWPSLREQCLECDIGQWYQARPPRLDTGWPSERRIHAWYPTHCN